MSNEKNEFPRRNRLDLNTSAELAIYNAMQEVEKAGASRELTRAIILLGDAKNAVANHVDGIHPVSGETDCKCGRESPGWTTIKCCNLCGKSVEPFWSIPSPDDKVEITDEEIEKAALEAHPEQYSTEKILRGGFKQGAKWAIEVMTKQK